MAQRSQRVVLLNPPVPDGRFTNRDLMGGMGIDDGFGVGLGPRLVALLKNEGTRLPVLALAYSAAVLAERGHEVVVLDQLRLDPDDPRALAAVADARPDWIVAATSYAFLGAELRFLERARRETGAGRLLVGYAATFFAAEILGRGLAEAVAKGDPEVAVGHLAAGTLAPGTDGVLMRDGNGGSLVPAGDAYVADLDAVPFPDWSGFPRGEYRYFPLLKRRPFLTVLSSRGCPYGCHFCPYPIGQGLDFRARSPRSVVDEIEHLATRFGVRSVLFRDPTFTLDMNRVKEIARQLAARGAPVEFGIETRLDRMDEEMIELLGAAGCRSAEFGVDPLDEQVRAASKRKGISPERAARLIRAMEANRIATAGLMVIGMPEQGDDDVERTVEWHVAVGTSYLNFEIATPFPGTPLYAQAVQRGWTRPLTLGDLLDGDPKLRFNGVIDLERMKRLQDRALNRFYFRPARLAREVRGVLEGGLVENLRFVAASGLKFVRGELKA